MSRHSHTLHSLVIHVELLGLRQLLETGAYGRYLRMSHQVIRWLAGIVALGARGNYLSVFTGFGQDYRVTHNYLTPTRKARTHVRARAFRGHVRD